MSLAYGTYSMNDEKKSWDDIPSLDDLRVDWNFQPENPHGRRDSQRLSDKELSKIFDVPCIAVKIATAEKVSKGLLQDISENGLAIRLQHPLQAGEKVKLGFFLGTHKIICQGTVRHVCQGTRGYTCGIQLQDVDDKFRSHIQGLYASMTLKQGL
ncbi:MAG: PilZ domain-containing protein [bacterium]|nr:PilZ domain-containing protein [bacterium]